MNYSKLLSILSEASDGHEYIDYKMKKRNESDGYEYDAGTRKFKAPHSYVDVETESEYEENSGLNDTVAVADDFLNQREQPKENMKKLSAVFAKLGGWNKTSSYRKIDKTQGEKAIPSVSEEVEEIDELSTQTLGSYAKKGVASALSKEKGKNRDPRKASKRRQSVALARYKMMKKEELELDEESMSAEQKKHVDAFMKSVKGKNLPKSEIDSAVKAILKNID